MANPANGDYQILVVDDDPGIFTAIEAFLYQENYRLEYISKGRKVLECLNDLQPDVILMDVMMPDINGLELCRQVKAHPVGCHIPIIMVTGLDTGSDLVRALDAGANDFIAKPIDGSELRARVRSMLRIKRQYDSLEATLRLREDLSNMVIHDLRAPLTNIILCSELLLQSNFGDKDLKRIEIIRSSGQELNSMINDLLIMAKMESGRLLLNYEDIDINQVTNSIITNFQALAQSKRITLYSQLTEHYCRVQVDKTLFHRMLENLISNAIKFSPSRTSVAVRLQPIESLGDKGRSPASTRIQVLDQGPGIKEELRQRIFEKYEIGDLMSNAHQIGLGLAFCKMVAEAHGGRIFVEQNDPRGSIFTVEI